MSKRSLLLAFSIGAIFGAILSSKIIKKQYEEIAQKDDFVINEQPNKTTRIIHDEWSNYADIIKKQGYIDHQEEKEGSAITDHPYIITPDNFGEKEEYDTISLYYYSDSVLTDEDDEPVDNIDEIIGLDSLKHFGEYGCDFDSLYVRNDQLKCDFEILLVEAKYNGD